MKRHHKWSQWLNDNIDNIQKAPYFCFYLSNFLQKSIKLCLKACELTANIFKNPKHTLAIYLFGFVQVCCKPHLQPPIACCL